MKKIDPKYIGVPNICFSLTDASDEREDLFSEQRRQNGFDESETWDLRGTIAEFIIPRLELYQEIANKKLVRSDELVRQIDEFLDAMKLIRMDHGACLFSEDEEERVQRGLKNFEKIFMSLWW